MGMLFRKKYTRPLPRGAVVGEEDGRRVARWQTRSGKRRSGEVIEGANGTLRVRGLSPFYRARYKDGRGQVVEVATNCRDEVAARAVLADLERRAELVRAGVITAEEDCAATHGDTSLARHLDEFEQHLRAKGGNPRRIAMVRRRLERLFRECRISKLSHLLPGPIEKWLVARAEARAAAATRNTYREAAVTFGNWCRRTHRLTHNPLADLPSADQNADRRHQRRAFTEPELLRLLEVACLRPLAEYGREITKKPSKRGKASRATWNREALTYETLDDAIERARSALVENPDLVSELERIGEERALVYKMLVLTGLRKGELASLRVGDLDLDGPVPHVVLHAASEKNRKGSSIPLRVDLAEELKRWLHRRLVDLRQEARDNGKAIPSRLPPAAPLLTVPSGLSRILDRDLAVAGIPKRDDRNRVVDVHALRMTFGTHLCRAGVPLRTVQAAMRHSKPELTANLYTDPRLLDVAGAVNALPSLNTTSVPAAAEA